MIPNVISDKTNISVQTDLSALHDSHSFDFSRDQNTLLSLENPQLTYDQDAVQGIIQPLGIAPDGTVINHHIPRLFKRATVSIIRSLAEQIESFPAYRGEFVRQLAAAMIPGLNDKDYTSLYTNPIHLIYRTVNGNLRLEGKTETVPCLAIFSLNNMLSIVTETETIKCSIELWDTLISGRELNLICNNEPFGKLQVLETVDAVDYSSQLPVSLLRSLNLRNEQELCNLFSPDDTSFVDIVLSVPSISQREANDLLAILHTRKLLSPYVRSKVCQIQLLTNPKAPFDWPELLGRFIFLLDPRWTFNNLKHLQTNDVMTIFRHVKEMNGGALYVLQTAFNTLDEQKGSDPILFFWTLLFLSIFRNATTSKNKQQSFNMNNKIISLWTELQKKDPNSGTRRLSQEIIDTIKNIRQFKLDSYIHEDSQFVYFIFKNHHDDIYKIFDLIPYRKEESHPLYYPVVLAIETALAQLGRNEALITSQSESLVSDYSLSDMSSSSSRRRKTNHTNESSQYYSESSRSHSSRHSSQRMESQASRSSHHSSRSAHSQVSHGSRTSPNRMQPPELSPGRQSGRHSSAIQSDAGINSDQYYSSSASSSRRRKAPPQLQQAPADESAYSYYSDYSSVRSKNAMTQQQMDNPSASAGTGPGTQKKDIDEYYEEEESESFDNDNPKNLRPTSSSTTVDEYTVDSEEGQRRRLKQERQSQSHTYSTPPQSPLTPQQSITTTSYNSRRYVSNYSVTDSYYTDTEPEIPLPPENRDQSSESSEEEEEEEAYQPPVQNQQDNQNGGDSEYEYEYSD